ncbi:MAG: hypothetical protein ABFD89_18515 [Bryobacteraceae bacterium]
MGPVYWHRYLADAGRRLRIFRRDMGDHLRLLGILISGGMMQDDEIKKVVGAVLAEQKRLHNNDIDEVVLKTIATILTSFGIEEEDRVELRADFIHLRKWRKSVEQAQGMTFKVIVTAIVGGFVGAMWLGIKAVLGK